MSRYVFLVLTLLLAEPAAGQVVDSVASEPPELERSYEREYAEAQQAAKRAAREQRRAEIGRGLRFELAPTVGQGYNTLLSQRGSAYHHHAFDAGAALLLHWPLSRRWDLSAGAGFRLSQLSFSNSVQFNTSSHTLVGHELGGWRDYRCLLSERSIVVPLRVNVVTNSLTNIYLGFNIAYALSNTFGYDRMGQNGDWEPDEELMMNNIETLGTWRAEVAVGMTFPLWWIFRWGWELYFSLTPTFDTSIAGTPSVHEFGLRLSL